MKIIISIEIIIYVVEGVLGGMWVSVSGLQQRTLLRL